MSNLLDPNNLPQSLPITKRMKDYSNQIFKNIQILYPYEKRKGIYIWVCKCLKCGSFFGSTGTLVTRENTQSCGCSRTNNLIGKKFGKLIVTKRAISKNGRNAYWYCDCDCGRKDYIVMGRNLIKGATKSCGCLLKEKVLNKTSKGEIQVSKILKEMGIKFYEEYNFQDLRGEYKELRFDFYIPEFNILIECQGQQHYMPVEIFNGEQQFKKQKEYDNKKKEYCLNKNLKLIEIPYWDYEKIDEKYIKEKIGVTIE